MNESNTTSPPAACVIFSLLILVAVAVTVFTLRKTPADTTFQYHPNANTLVEVDVDQCADFGRVHHRSFVQSLSYTVNGVDRVAKNNGVNLSDNLGVKACVAAFTHVADQYGILTSHVYQRFETLIKDNIPYMTAYYLNGSKLNAITLPVEACVNPQFDGPVTFSYQNDVFHTATVNTIEHEMGYLMILDNACDALKTRGLRPKSRY